MFGLAIGAGLVVSYLVGSFIGNVVFERADAGFFPGIVAGIWVAWPLLHKHAIERANFLHPPAKTYSVNFQEVFSRLVELLKETSYGYGDKWQITKADPATGRIIASLRFMEEERRIYTNNLGQMQTRPERVQRYVELAIQLTSQGANDTTIQLDFEAVIGGAKSDTIDSVIAGFQEAIETCIGKGSPVREPLTHNITAPPWWLLGMSVLMLLGLIGEAGKSVNDVITDLNKIPEQLKQAKAYRIERESMQDQELNSWRQFKESQHL